MNRQNIKEKSHAKLPTRAELILIEREIVNKLQRMLNNPDLTFVERLRAANVLAFHMNTLNRMLIQNGEKEAFKEETLGDYVKGLEPRIFRRFRRDFRVWKRTLSLKRF